MPTTVILQATHTHLYPGHRGKISGLESITDLMESSDCLVEFSDGTATSARISKTENAWQLDADAYRTAAGTNITAKAWLVRLQETRDQVDFRILKNVV